MALRHFLLKIGFLDLNSQRMQKLVDASNSGMIHWAFENGRYDVRLQAVHYFAKNMSPVSIPLLEKAMNDETEVVSQTAMSGLENISDSKTVHQEIATKRQYWIDENAYREGRRNREHRKESVLITSKERGSKKTLDNVRNMLKKPMNGGKWF